MAREKKRRPRGRRSTLAAVVLVGVGLLISGGLYAGASAAVAATTSPNTAQDATLSTAAGKKLFQANCATCHNMNLSGTKNGPSLYGVGELAVEFQVSTGRMPLAMQGPEAQQKPPQFTPAQIRDIAAYVQSVSPGPTYPSSHTLDAKGDVANGADLFRTNCAMCHNVAGAGGALTEGKSAPSLVDPPVTPLNMYAAMVTGPESMPVFNNMNLSLSEKRDIISYLVYLQQHQSPGGFGLGDLGPVSEGLFIWIFGIGTLVGVTVWITAKSN